MAGLWCLYRHWREDGDCYFCYQAVFYLYLLSHVGVSHRILSNLRFLDEYQKLY